MKALAVSMACCSSRGWPPRPVMAVTERAMPQLRTFCPMAIISAAGWPLRMSFKTSSLPDSNPI